jgi:hypothetical protein
MRRSERNKHRAGTCLPGICRTGIASTSDIVGGSGPTYARALPTSPICFKAPCALQNDPSTTCCATRISANGEETADSTHTLGCPPDRHNTTYGLYAFGDEEAEEVVVNVSRRRPVLPEAAACLVRVVLAWSRERTSSRLPIKTNRDVSEQA